MTAPPELAGRRALVTGAGSGIGLATAERLQQLGAQVAAVVQNEEQAQQLQHCLPDALVLVQDLLQVARPVGLARTGGAKPGWARRFGLLRRHVCKKRLRRHLARRVAANP